MDTEQLPGLEEATPTKCPIYRRERHLASAITLTEFHYMIKHRDNHAALRPHHKRMLEEVKDMYILPAQDFLSWCVRNLNQLCNDRKEDHETLRRAEKVAHLAAQGSYTHFYKTPPPSLTQEPFPLDTLYARLAITWNRVVSNVAQSSIPK